MIAGKKASLPNKENIGAVIFALSLAKNNVTDLNRTPVGTRDFIIDTLGQITAIPKTIRSACSHHPETQAEFERTYASLLPDMQAAIGRSQHSLQVLNLAGERTGLAKSANASRDLLDAAGLPHYPQELKSRLECALIMDCVTDQAPAEFRARLGHVRDAALSGKPLSAQAATVISELRALGKGDNALYSKQLELCDGFMRSPGRSSAASSPPPL